MGCMQSKKSVHATPGAKETQVVPANPMLDREEFENANEGKKDSENTSDYLLIQLNQKVDDIWQ